MINKWRWRWLLLSSVKFAGELQLWYAEEDMRLFQCHHGV
jgi:hypothetical protein